MLEHLACNGRACNGRSAKLRRLAAKHQHLAEFNDLAGLAVDPINTDHVLGGYPVLFATSLDDCEHLSSSCSIPALGLFRTGFFQSVCCLFLRA